VTGRSSIPETPAIEPGSHGLLDTPCRKPDIPFDQSRIFDLNNSGFRFNIAPLQDQNITFA
jgi:hypothetical protein